MLNIIRLAILFHVAALLLFAPFAALAKSNGDKLFHQFPKGKTVYESRSQYQWLELVAGRIEYRRSPKGEEGFLAEKVVAFEGESRYQVIDHSPSATALKLYRDFEKNIERRGGEVVFRCAGSHCGELSGWQLYLSDKLLGSENSQYYLLGKTIDSRGQRYYLQFFILELDGQARSFARVAGPWLPEQLNSALASDTVSVFFANNSSELAGPYRALLDQFANRIIREKASHIMVSGYADSAGSQSYNAKLSMQRASYIAQQLRSRLGNYQVKIEHRGIGASAAFAKGDTSQARQKNRRVTLKILSNKAED